MSRARAVSLFSAAVISLLGGSGCNLPLERSSQQIGNSCDTTQDCGGAGVCVAVGSGKACVGTVVDLTGLLIEVRPSPNALIAPDTSYILDPASLGLGLVGSDGAGLVESYNPSLPALATITTGTVKPKDKSCPVMPGTAGGFTGVQAADGSIAATIELDRVSKLSGLPAARYITSTTYDATNASQTFTLSVPPDVYDVYVTPSACPPLDPTNPNQPNPSSLPPAYIPDVNIATSADLNITLPLLRNLSGDITLPKGVSIANWTVDLVEPEGGRVISTAAILTPKALEFSAHFQNEYYWTQLDSPVIRLRPPDGVVGPTLYWDLASVDIDGDGQVALTLFSYIDSQPKAIQANVVDDAGQPVIANVTMESVLLSNNGTSAVTNAAYKVAVDTDAQGSFQAEILPGTYRVLARPSSDRKALAVVNPWTIKVQDFCCGRSITVGDKATIDGRALTPADQPMPGSSVVASPSAPPSVSYFNGAIGQTPILPREATGSPDASGAFALSVDSGQFDLSVRPRGGSLFPWVVRPSVTVDANEALMEVGALVMSFPVIVRGTIRDPLGNQTVSGATVRAWLPVSGPDDGVATTVVQIGETTTDDSGNYVLPLPPASIPPP